MGDKEKKKILKGLRETGQIENEPYFDELAKIEERQKKEYIDLTKFSKLNILNLDSKYFD